MIKAIMIIITITQVTVILSLFVIMDPARTATAVYSCFSFFCRRSGCLLLLSSELRPSACC